MADKPTKASPAMTPDEPKPGATMGGSLASAAIDFSKFKRRNLPPIVKPGDIPIGSAISGKILKVCDSPVTTIKGKLLWLRHDSGTEFMFPVTGTIRTALDDDLNKEVGKMFIAKRGPDGSSKKYGKAVFMFEVFTN